MKLGTFFMNELFLYIWGVDKKHGEDSTISFLRKELQAFVRIWKPFVKTLKLSQEKKINLL